MTDHTILYYTANLIPESFAVKIRKNIVELCNGIPVISISHRPIGFGENICVEGFPVSAYSVYKQILIGARKATTKYVICCEDDALYVPEHFTYIPPDDIFMYNINRWHIVPNFYFYRHRRLMSMCVANRELMIDTLEKRFEKYSEQVPHFGEPGRHEARMGLPIVKIDEFSTEIPTITFCHKSNMGGRRGPEPRDMVREELPFWGKAKDLWERVYG
jgi:hypothetical protein